MADFKEKEMQSLLNEVNDLSLGNESGAAKISTVAISAAVCGPILVTTVLTVTGPIVPIYRK